MGAMADRINAIHVHASAPGGGIHGEVRGHNSIEIYFSSGYYDQANERQLERQLEGLARLLWTARERALRTSMAEFNVHPDESISSYEDERFHEERAQLLAVGCSDDDRIVVSVRGMQEWRVQLAAGTLQAHSERSFLAGLQVAATRLISNQLQQVNQLKVQVYQ
ncbi:hypothetical protein [Plantactinospora sp. KLBMP9567]|uniref:hypothetical protein n=1 Tax=Plantactinospora sp. KLBMP9567 TaxID=3085900 RepID=UPI0029827615|nr:hypothetical protein [Plantactinospora sp. KLBMP9567]MDW5326430.1 hypothetical protein [Plantactinospora sp. KLBMP9567]